MFLLTPSNTTIDKSFAFKFAGHIRNNMMINVLTVLSARYRAISNSATVSIGANLRSVHLNSHKYFLHLTKRNLRNFCLHTYLNI